MAVHSPPTPLESRILAILWKQPDATVRDVGTALNDDKKRAYTTVLTVLQGMERKGLVGRHREGLTDHWSAKVGEDAVARPMLKDLIQRIFGGRRKLALHYLLEDENLSEQEWDELQAMIDAARKRKR